MKIIILGAGQVGGTLAENLASEQNDITVVDTDGERLRALQDRLDIGTVNDSSRVVNSFKVILADPRVKAILINIFGGMARTDVIAEGTVEAMKSLDLKVPVVVRLAGTNVEEGHKIIADSGLPIITADDLGEAAKKAVEAASVTA